jgi:hypothetical protein
LAVLILDGGERSGRSKIREYVNGKSIEGRK